MIPTLLIAGLAVGLLPRPWAIAGVVLLAIGWAVVLLATNVVNGAGNAFAAAGLGLANAAVGALAGQAVRATVRMTREG